jgi:hypothetical protein
MAAEHDAGAARPETHAPQGESSSATEHDSRPRGPTVEQRRGGPATVRIRLCPEEGTPREFVPLKVPRGIDVALDEIGPDLVRELSAELELELRPGSYSLALGEHLPLLAEVAAGSRCKARLSVGRAADRPKALLKGARLDFEPAVGLRNVVPILGKLHTLFEDRGLALCSAPSAAVAARAQVRGSARSGVARPAGKPGSPPSSTGWCRATACCARESQGCARRSSGSSTSPSGC